MSEKFIHFIFSIGLVANLVGLIFVANILKQHANNGIAMMKIIKLLLINQSSDMQRKNDDTMG